MSLEKWFLLVGFWGVGWCGLGMLTVGWGETWFKVMQVGVAGSLLALIGIASAIVMGY